MVDLGEETPVICAPGVVLAGWGGLAHLADLFVLGREVPWGLEISSEVHWPPAEGGREGRSQRSGDRCQRHGDRRPLPSSVPRPWSLLDCKDFPEGGVIAVMVKGATGGGVGLGRASVTVLKEEAKCVVSPGHAPASHFLTDEIVSEKTCCLRVGGRFTRSSLRIYPTFNQP